MQILCCDCQCRSQFLHCITTCIMNDSRFDHNCLYGWHFSVCFFNLSKPSSKKFFFISNPFSSSYTFGNRIFRQYTT